MSNNWYNSTYKNDVGIIDLYGDIGDYGLTAEVLISEIKRSEATNLILNISSLGGSVNDALQIYDFIKGFQGTVKAKITGLTASSATIISMGADVVEMSENALFLIHNVWTPMAVGNAEDLEKSADDLRKIDEILINIYKSKTKKDKRKIASLMAEEKWLNAKEAKDMGFIDKIYKPNMNLINSIILNKINLNKLPQLPKGVMDEFSEIKNYDLMNFEKINDKIDALMNKVEGFFDSKNESENVIDKGEFTAKVDKEIEELKNLYEWQINEQSETIKLKDEQISDLKNNYDSSINELKEEVEKLKANETVVVKEEEPTLEKVVESPNPFDSYAERLRK